MTSTLQAKRQQNKAPLQASATPPQEAQQEASEGVLVRFNCTTQVHMMPDENYEEECADMLSLRRKDFKSYRERIVAGSLYEYRTFNAGDVARVPHWYYNNHKDDVVTLSVHIPRIRDKNGYLRPFLASDAVMHGHVDNDDTMRTVKRFELADEAEVA